MIRPLALILTLLAAPAAAADAVAVAEDAVARLEAAGAALAEAEGASDRVAALTQVIGAYETGLAALREGLRQAAIREAALTRGLDRDSARVARLLGALESLEATPETLLLMHPSGPVGSVRAGMMMADVMPGLQAQVADLRARLDEIRLIRALQESALDSIAAGLDGVQAARTELSVAISNREDLPGRLSDDGPAIARLLENTDTLASFAEGLVGLSAADAPAAGADLPSTPFPLPAGGRVLRRFGEADAAGIARPGWLVATAPQALVTAPLPATIRYLGPLLDYGNVMILEPDPDTLLVLAGLAQVYGAPGQVVAQGAPLGMMGGTAPTGSEFVAASVDGTGAELPETLYVELRKSNDPVDPAEWFEGTKDGTE